jgi:hypothetical protein
MTNDEIAVSLTEALAQAGVPLAASAANKVLHSAGMIERAWREFEAGPSAEKLLAVDGRRQRARRRRGDQ